MKKLLAFILSISIFLSMTVCHAEEYNDMSIEELEILKEKTFEELTRINQALSSKKLAMRESAEAIEGEMTIESLFPDENLAMYIRNELGKISIKDPVTQEELDSFTQIEFSPSRGDGKVANLVGISHLRNLESISLDFKDGAEFPEELLQLPYLSRINVAYYDHPALPEWFTQLSGLTYVGLKVSSLTCLPDDIDKLTELRSIALDTSQNLKSIPYSIGQLTHLEKLSLGYTSITEIPDTLGNCLLLNYLNVSHTSISEIPATVLALNIETLNISNTNIK